MQIMLDIPKATKPIIRKTLNIEERKSIESITRKAELDQLLNGLILAIEGFYKFIPALHKETIESMLPRAKEAVANMTEADEHRKKVHYLNDAVFKEKFLYALKALYKLHSLLHIAYYKRKLVIETPEYVKTGFPKISIEAVSHSLHSKIKKNAILEG